ncbi:hypothetical protein C1893_02425 [Pseudomonas sp. MPR-ANC1]|uniref:hypothetical protein n=1 Tax=Pseudomonas sp. MPR-ANC1 TaxID=2075548 RepID=UPI000CD1A6DC|nr:hypothetical protein [Pseudomonas sp. MPR-ANC1]POA50421.1 hypothetical protein C1893_02425 [Pseudomonas sp. MPR-ANC1]
MNSSHCVSVFLMLLCAGCAKTPVIPPAELALLSFEKSANNSFIVNFSSTVNLLIAFNHYERSNQLNPTLICSLDGDMEFSSEHAINVKAEGRVEENSENPSGYEFTTELLFYNVRHDGTQHDLNDYEAIRPLLIKQSFIPCKVRITAYGYKAYYTQTLLIPSTLMQERMFR